MKKSKNKEKKFFEKKKTKLKFKNIHEINF